MRILFWTELFWPYIGGVEVLSCGLARALLPLGYEVRVVTSHGSLDLPDEAEFHGIPIHRFPFQTALAAGKPAQLLELRRRVVQLKRDYRPQLVHVHFSDPSVFFHLQTQGSFPAPALLSLCLGLPEQPAGADTILGQALRAASWVIAPSAAILCAAHRLAPETQARSSVIYNGLQAPPLPPEPLPFQAPRVLCLGRVVWQKGFDLALAAWALLGQRFQSARLAIAGDGPERTALEARATALGIAHSVDFLGWVQPEEVPALINSSTIVVVPSRWQEAFGLVALQAAQLARPVIAARVGGLPEVVVDGETGLLVEVEDAGALARALAFLLERPATAVQLGQQAHRRAEAVFGWEPFVAAHDRLYRTRIHPR